MRDTEETEEREGWSGWRHVRSCGWMDTGTWGHKTEKWINRDKR